jgi:hypothetical protein
VRQIGPVKLVAVMSQMGCERLRINDRTKDQVADLAVAFCPTEEAAFQALHKLKNLRIEGTKILASFRYLACVPHASMCLSRVDSLPSLEMSAMAYANWYHCFMGAAEKSISLRLRVQFS